MKKGKHILALLLIIAMIVAMSAGCGSNSNTTQNSGGFTEPPYEVVLQTVTFGGRMVDVPLVEAAINAITLPAINCTVKLKISMIQTLPTDNPLAISGGEKIDLIMVGLNSPLASNVSSGILEPLDDVLAANGQNLATLFGDTLDAGVVDGIQYAIPADPYPAAGKGFIYNADMAAEYGITMPEGPLTFADLDTIFAQLHAANPDVFGTCAYNALTGVGYFYDIGSFGDTANQAYGVVLNPAESTNIVNVYATPEYLEYSLKMKEWIDKGYMKDDSLTDSTSSADLMKALKIFGNGTFYSPREIVAQASNYTFATNIIETLPALISSESIQETMWGIPITSERPDMAMKFLDLMFTNSEIGNLLCNGIEDRHYFKVSDNIIKLPDGVKKGNLGYFKLFSRFGDTMKIFQNEPASEGFYADLKAFNDIAGYSMTTGYTFNSEPVSAEVAAVTNVIIEYRPALECGQVDDVPAALAEFNQALKDNGIDTIIAENQKQLDAWLAARG